MAKLTNFSWFKSPKKKRAKKAKNKSSAATGFLSFELSKLMSRTIRLYSSLTVPNLRLDGLRRLVSADVSSLALAEHADTLLSLARAVTCIASSRCVDPLLRRFPLLFADLLDTGADPCFLRYEEKKMARKLRKMERHVTAASSLYQELEVLAELEQRGPRFSRKLTWQKKEVKCLRKASLWNRSYDYAVRLLARSLFTIAARMNRAVVADAGTDPLLRSYSFAGVTIYPSDSDGGRRLARFSSLPLSRDTVSGVVSDSEELGGKRHGSWRKKKWSVSGRSFSGCIAGDSELPVTDSCMRIDVGSRGSNAMKYMEAEVQVTVDIFVDMKLSQALFEPRCTLLNAAVGTLGAAALHLHYANVITVIEKFVACPHLIGPDARDDLYYMLTTNIRAELRTRLKPYAKNLRSSVYDPVLASEWSEAVTRIFDWLSPLAHNTIKWQSERNFEQQLLISSSNVLLVQTLYFANQAKTEAAITELLVGLNYLWRFGKELNAQATSECVSNRKFDECLNLNG